MMTVDIDPRLGAAYVTERTRQDSSDSPQDAQAGAQVVQEGQERSVAENASEGTLDDADLNILQTTFDAVRAEFLEAQHAYAEVTQRYEVARQALLDARLKAKMKTSAVASGRAGGRT